MNIIEALQTGKKFRRSCWDDDLCIYPDQNVIDGLSNNDLLATDYELYTPEIRPKEAGEVWVNTDGNVVFIHEASQFEGLMATKLNGFKTGKYDSIIHGQNGWTRERPPVEDCEKVEIELPQGSIALADLFSQIMAEGKQGKLIFIPKKEEG